MSSFVGFRKVFTAGVSGIALAATLAMSAQAQHAEYLTASATEVRIASENLGVATDTRLADAVQAQFENKQFEETLKERNFSPDVILAARLAYAERVFEPIWTREGAQSLAEAYADPTEYGLPADTFEHVKLDRLINKRFSGKTSEKADADIRLTAAWLEIASRVSGDLNDIGAAKSSPEAGPARSELVALLIKSGSGAADQTIEAVEPEQPQYQKLKKLLESYQQIAKDGGWKAIPASDDSLEPGQMDPRVPALRGRLIAEGYYAGPKITEIVKALSATVSEETAENAENSENTYTPLESWLLTFDEGLEKALKSFQSHHGLDSDGVLGRKTLAALNESVESKILRVENSLEKWRSQGDMGDRYVWANIPSYQVEGWADGQREIDMKSIVGLPSRATPVFSDEIEYTVANPRWYAPVSIVARDKLPKLQKDPSYAARNGYTIYDRSTGDAVSAQTVDWSDPSSASDYQFVQAAGSGNALGELKIIFPNKHAVYLHGTPTTYLFDRAERAFSSGCVRLEDPAAMARWLAEETSGEEVEETINAALETGRNRKVTFEETTPVHLTYFTVTVGDDGKGYFWRDIYNREDGITMETDMATPYTPSEQTQPPVNQEIASVETKIQTIR
ncbi:MAG: hypothetical protein CMK07_06245 [Ponticaulis sp.]|nr:hypothetical protein [Ponticaulis sp.]